MSSALDVLRQQTGKTQQASSSNSNTSTVNAQNNSNKNPALDALYAQTGKNTSTRNAGSLGQASYYSINGSNIRKNVLSVVDSYKGRLDAANKALEEADSKLSWIDRFTGNTSERDELRTKANTAQEDYFSSLYSAGLSGKDVDGYSEWKETVDKSQTQQSAAALSAQTWMDNALEAGNTREQVYSMASKNYQDALDNYNTLFNQYNSDKATANVSVATNSGAARTTYGITDQQLADAYSALVTARNNLTYAEYYRFANVKSDPNYQSAVNAGAAYWDNTEIARQQSNAQQTSNMYGSADYAAPSAFKLEGQSIDEEIQSYREPTSDWNDEQRNTFYYLIGIGDSERASEYALSVNNSINAKKQNLERAKVDTHATDGVFNGIVDTVGTVMANALGVGVADVILDTYEYVKTGDIATKPYLSPAQISNEVRGAISNELNSFGVLDESLFLVGGKGFGDAYQLVTSIADSMATVNLGSALVGGKAVAQASELAGNVATGIVDATFFFNSAAQGIYDGLERGLDPKQALELGYMNGFAEVLGETLSADKLIHMTSTSSVKEIIVQGLIEGSEEWNTEWMNRFAEAIAAGDKSQINQAITSYMAEGKSYEEAVKLANTDFLRDAAWAAATGAASGVASSSLTISASKIAGTQTATEEQIRNVSDRAAVLSEDNSLRKQADEYVSKFESGEKVSQNKVGKLASDLETAIQENDKKALTEATMNRLVALGETEHVYSQAKAIAEQVMQQYNEAKPGDSIKQLIDETIASRDENAGVIRNGEKTRRVYEELLSRTAGDTEQDTHSNNWAGLISTQEFGGKNLNSMRSKINSENFKKARVKSGKVGGNTTEDKPITGTVDLSNPVFNKAENKIEFHVNNPDGTTTTLKQEQLNLTDEQQTVIQNLEETLGDQSAVAFSKINDDQAPWQYAIEFGTIMNVVSQSAIDVNTEEGMAKAQSIAPVLTKSQILLADSLGKSGAAKVVQNKSGKGTGRIITDTDVKLDGMILKKPVNVAQKVSTKEMQYLESIAKALEIDIVLFESQKNSKGVFQGANGAYRDGVIYLDVNAGRITANRGKKMMFTTLSHELTHFIQQNNSGMYEELKNFVTTRLVQDMGGDFNTLVQAKIARSRGSMSYAEAVDEVVADACETMLSNSSAIETLAKENKTLYKAIKNFIHDFISRFSKAISTYDMHTEAKYMQKYVDELQQKWDTGLIGAAHGRTDATTTIDAATETDIDGDPVPVQKSTKSMVEGAGFTFHTDRNGNFDYMLDEDGNVVTDVTADHIRNSPIGDVIQYANDNNFITADDVDNQLQMFADIMNMINKHHDATIVWDMVGTTVFSAMKSNADKQYSKTIDFSTVCKKTQAIVDAMSAVMLKKGRGLTREEVELTYLETAKAGETVPCPVCYVFSRWMGAGGILDNIKKYQTKYGSMSEEDLIKYAAEVKQSVYDFWAAQGKTSKFDGKDGWKYGKALSEMKTKLGAKSASRLKDLSKSANAALKIQELQALLENGDLTKGQRRKIEGQIATQKRKILSDEGVAKVERDVKANDDAIERLEAYQFVMKAILKEEKDGTVHMLEEFKKSGPIPDNILFDLNKGAEFAEQYPSIWAYRTTRGAAAGKAIVPYSDARVGETIQGVYYASVKDVKIGLGENPFLKRDAETTKDIIENAIAKMRKQNLIGGQRYQSTSDFRYEYGSDYLLTFLEMQAVGANVQLYTKVIEAVDFLASMGADCNLSVMPLGDGFIIQEDGTKKLVYSSVTGIDAEAALKKTKQYDNVQCILVGISDEHIRLALHGDDITFVIPFHGSGNTTHQIQALMNMVGEDLDVIKASDYTAVQGDHFKKKRTQQEIDMWKLRMAIIMGELGEEGLLDSKQVQLLQQNKYLNELYNKFYNETDNKAYHTFLNKDQAEQIFPYEYWDESLTYDQANQNGERFKEYCATFGIIPRFSGMDSDGKKVGYGDFTQDKGYWKLLIDRRMYNLDGTYHSQKRINVSDFNIGMLDAKEASLTYGDAMSKANDPSKTNGIRDRVIEQIDKRAQMSDRDLVDSSDTNGVKSKYQDIERRLENDGRAEESAEDFAERARANSARTISRGEIVYAIKPYTDRPSANAKRARQEFRKTGINTFYFSEIDENRKGITTRYKTCAFSDLGQVEVGISGILDDNPVRIFNHEFYHLSAENREAADLAFEMNADIYNPNQHLLEYTERIIGLYYKDGFTNEDESVLIEEIRANLIGDLMCYDNTNHAFDCFKDPYKVIQAWMKVKDDIASSNKAQYSDRDMSDDDIVSSIEDLAKTVEAVDAERRRGHYHAPETEEIRGWVSTDWEIGGLHSSDNSSKGTNVLNAISELQTLRRKIDKYRYQASEDIRSRYDFEKLYDRCNELIYNLMPKLSVKLQQRIAGNSSYEGSDQEFVWWLEDNDLRRDWENTQVHYFSGKTNKSGRRTDYVTGRMYTKKQYEDLFKPETIAKYSDREYTPEQLSTADDIAGRMATLYDAIDSYDFSDNYYRDFESAKNSAKAQLLYSKKGIQGLIESLEDYAFQDSIEDLNDPAMEAERVALIKSLKEWQKIGPDKEYLGEIDQKRGQWLGIEVPEEYRNTRDASEYAITADDFDDALYQERDVDMTDRELAPETVSAIENNATALKRLEKELEKASKDAANISRKIRGYQARRNRNNGRLVPEKTANEIVNYFLKEGYFIPSSAQDMNYSLSKEEAVEMLNDYIDTIATVYGTEGWRVQAVEAVKYVATCIFANSFHSVSEDENSSYSRMKSALRNVTLKLSDSEWKQIGKYEDWKSNYPFLRLSKTKGQAIDTWYNDNLAGQGDFGPITSATDILEKLREVYDNRESDEKVSDFYSENYSEEKQNEVMADWAERFVDRTAEEVKKRLEQQQAEQKSADQKAIEELKYALETQKGINQQLLEQLTTSEEIYSKAREVINTQKNAIAEQRYVLGQRLEDAWAERKAAVAEYEKLQKQLEKLRKRIDEKNAKISETRKEGTKKARAAWGRGFITGVINQGIKDAKAQQTALNRAEAKAQKEKASAVKKAETVAAKAAWDRGFTTGVINQGIKDAKRLKSETERYEKKLKEKADRIEKLKSDQKSKIAELEQKRKDQRKQMIADYRDRSNKKAFKTRIAKQIADLNKMLLHGNKNSYVPTHLVQQTIEILEAINLDNGRSQKIRAKLLELQAKYKELENDPDYGKAVYDPVVAQLFQNMVQVVGDTPIGSMSAKQLSAVLDTLKAMHKTIVDAQKVKINGEERAAYAVSQAMIAETNSVRKPQENLIAFFRNKHLRAQAAFNMFGGHHMNSVWNAVYEMLDDGQLEQTRIMMEATKIFEGLMVGNHAKDYENLTNYKNVVDLGITDKDGNPVYITHGMMLSLYMHLMNEDNARHVARGGLTIPDIKAYYTGTKGLGFGTGTVSIPGVSVELADVNHRIYEMQKKVSQEIADAKSKGASQADIDAIKSQLDALYQERDDILADGDAYVGQLLAKITHKLSLYDKQFIMASKALFDGYSKDHLNATTLAVYGIKKAQVDNYFPIVSDPNFLQKDFESVAMDRSLENAGFMKDRVQGVNPMLLFDITDVINKQINSVAQYCGMMPAVRNFNKIYNKTMPGYSDSLRKAINGKFGQVGLEWIDNLLGDLNGARRREVNVLDIIRGNMAQASLTMSLRTAFSQTASFPTAAAVVGWKPLAKALLVGGKNNWMFSAADRELIAKYSPLLWYRTKGNSTVELGDLASSNSKMAKLWRKLKFLTGWIEAMDAATVGRLWYAAQYYVDEQNVALMKGTDAYYREVAKVFNRIIEETQPNYTTLQRPDILRDPNALTRALTMFMTQRLQNANIIYDSQATLAQAKIDADAGKITGDQLKQAKKNAANAISSQIVATATLAAFKFLADAIMHDLDKYRDDDDELTSESILERLMNVSIESIMSNFLGGSEIYSLVNTAVTGDRYYGLEVSSISSVSDLLESLQGFLSTMLSKNRSITATKKYSIKLAKSVATLFGWSVNNAMKIINAMINHATDIVNGEFLSFESGTERSAGTQARRIYAAAVAGDKDKAAEVREDAIEAYMANDHTRSEAEDYVDGQIRGLIQSAYVNDKKIDKKTAISQLQNIAGMNKREAEEQVNKWTCEIVTGIKYTEIKDEFMKGNITSSRAIDMMMKYGGKTKESATETVNSYKCEKQYGFGLNELKQAVIDGELDASRALSARITFGGDTREEAQEKTSYWSFLRKNPSSKLTQSQYTTWSGKGLKDAGISAGTYEKYVAKRAKLTGDDLDGDGKADSGTKKTKVLALIDSLPISTEAKDALYLAEGYGSSSLKKAPWH